MIYKAPKSQKESRRNCNCCRIVKTLNILLRGKVLATTNIQQRSSSKNNSSTKINSTRSNKSSNFILLQKKVYTSREKSV